ncbi:MAG: hypothetical protein JWN04_4092 [Myxococcaceae bacterium]|nr:hypothetical protein [Myxococcaceae bacterium]
MSTYELFESDTVMTTGGEESIFGEVVDSARALNNRLSQLIHYYEHREQTDGAGSFREDAFSPELTARLHQVKAAIDVAFAGTFAVTAEIKKRGHWKGSL